MKAKTHVANPDEMVLTLDISMTVKQWREVAAVQDKDKWPAWPLAALIRDAIDAHVKTITTDTEQSR